ncbi:MAG: hypothetical protein KAT65_27445 [Methanophagales archaeon]|nr:hypothetical protein [Methanophagales archaeon]
MPESIHNRGDKIRIDAKSESRDKKRVIKMQNKLILKILAISIVLVIVASSIAVSANTMDKALNGSDSKVSLSSTTIYVPYNYATIQAAVNAAYPGDTIMVKDGTYIENIKVDKSLTIRSENGSDSTIVRAEDPDDHIFKVTRGLCEYKWFLGGRGNRVGLCWNISLLCRLVQYIK